MVPVNPYLTTEVRTSTHIIVNRRAHLKSLDISNIDDASIRALKAPINCAARMWSHNMVSTSNCREAKTLFIYSIFKSISYIDGHHYLTLEIRPT